MSSEPAMTDSEVVDFCREFILAFGARAKSMSREQRDEFAARVLSCMAGASAAIVGHLETSKTLDSLGLMVGMKGIDELLAPKEPAAAH
jgi:hypothetical protein